MFILGLKRLVKISFAQMIITWNTEVPFNSILYDSKFVDLMLVAIIGKDRLINNQYSKNEMRFIKGKK